MRKSCLFKNSLSLYVWGLVKLSGGGAGVVSLGDGDKTARRSLISGGVIELAEVF